MNKLLIKAEILVLSLMILSLPSLEAPKNIFLVVYLTLRIISEIFSIRRGVYTWSVSDNIFLILVLSAWLSTVFAGMPHLEEWKGYRVFLTAVLIGWSLSRSRYSNQNRKMLIILIVISTIPPLFFGIYQYIFMHTKPDLQLHSVGHVNHSAIYLTMIFGASLGWLSNYKKRSLATKIYLSAITFIFFISLIIGQSRGAFGIAIIMAILILFLMNKSIKTKIIGLVSIGCILAMMILFNANIVKKQLTNQANNNTLAYRDKVWNVSIEAARFSPVLGIGMSNWHFISTEQLKKSVEKRGEKFYPEKYWNFVGHSHSLYLTALVERGVVGLITTLIFMLWWIQSLYVTYNRTKKDNLGSFIWVGSLSAWISTFGIGLINTTFHHEHAILACLFLGLHLSHFRAHQKKI